MYTKFRTSHAIYKSFKILFANYCSHRKTQAVFWSFMEDNKNLKQLAVVVMVAVVVYYIFMGVKLSFIVQHKLFVFCDYFEWQDWCKFRIVYQHQHVPFEILSEVGHKSIWLQCVFVGIESLSTFRRFFLQFQLNRMHISVCFHTHIHVQRMAVVFPIKRLMA